MKRPAVTCPGTFVIITPSDPAPSGTVRSWFLAHYISQKEQRVLSELRGQAVRSQVLEQCQAWLHPCCRSCFWLHPGVSPLLPQWWWLSPCRGSGGWARQGSLVSAGGAHILPVPWVLEKYVWVFSFDFFIYHSHGMLYQVVSCGVDQV